MKPPVKPPLSGFGEGRPAYGDEGPIAAFATPPGESALTLIRCAGKNAVELAASVFSRPQKLREAPANSVIHGWIVENRGPEDGGGGRAPEKIDEVMAAVYRAPKSYTGEDGLDISCHGGPAAGQAVMRTLRAAGFRDALPGEFTLRAFLNGKLGLTQAESVMELVSARGDLGRRRAVGRLSGALETEIRAVKNLLVEVLAGTELFLDYSEDELAASGAEVLGLLPERPRAEEALARLEKLAASWAMEQLCRDGALAVIAGRPNAGKSSLFNLLLKEERSIVTEIPGTTRDWIEGWLSLEGFPLRLMDTAGLRDRPGTDPVERIGMERSRELIEQADIILYVIDGAGGLAGEDRAFLDTYGSGPGKKPPLITIWNKADVAGTELPGGGALTMSAKTGRGLPELIAALKTALAGIAGGVWEQPALESPGIGTVRQKELIDKARAAATEALSLSAQGEALDLIAPLLREAVNALGEITGEVSTADILETMFSRFCVGK
ncbi:MAG: tRNA uridine-5-carboxymethylaminomethyl(34) synthesis GTPase MnmE [Treponema sp.]|jgi:tRNA modification GTPase|nr:tRNA uridine-5-carboxymethylaminomethyl(34) synthesis GTPase MnmE [Treponema sp.]